MRVCIYMKKAYLFVGQLVMVWNFYLKYWASVCAQASWRGVTVFYHMWFIDVVGLKSR